VNEWVWSIGGMVLTGENWSTGRGTLYSADGRWMSGYGALVEWYWQGKPAVLGENPVTMVLCPPQMQYGLTWDRTLASAVKGRRLIAWYSLNPHLVYTVHKISSYRTGNTLSLGYKTSQLMLYREIIAVCSQIHAKHINTLCGQNVDLYIKIQSVPRSKHTQARLYKPVS